MKQKLSRTTKIQSANLIIDGELDRFEYPYFMYTLELFHQYDKSGTLPFPGSHSEQPAQISEVLDLIKSIQIEDETKQIKKIEKESNRG